MGSMITLGIGRMEIDWGVTPLMGYQEDSTENVVSHALYVVKREKKVKIAINTNEEIIIEPYCLNISFN